MQEGDRAKWVVAGATTCESTDDATAFATVGADGSATFTFGTTVQQLLLCYKFRYAATGDAATAYLLFPAITLSLIRVDVVTPTSTAVGCSSDVHVSGAGFAAAAAVRTPTCALGALGAGVAVVVNDSLIRCTTVSASYPATATLRLDFGSLTAAHPDVVRSFAVYDATSVSISSIFPAGGGYNLQTTVTLSGSFADYGAPRCRFGSYEGALGLVINSTHLSCGKPRFPDSERTSLGAYTVTVAANGQCYSPSSVAFTTYNSQLNSIATSGAPSSSSVALTLTGEGFADPGLPSGLCLFQKTAPGALITKHTELTTLSSKSVSCPTPVGSVGTWSVSILQNGLTPEPTLFGAPTFTTYDLATVVVSELVPPGGLVGAPNTVIVHGAGFASYGTGQLICRAGNVDVPGTLLDSSRVRCAMPAIEVAQTVDVRVSLNGGSAGTFTATQRPFATYAQPTITSVSPSLGSAEGGTRVVLWGTGFTALSTDATLRSSYLRLRFGSGASAAELTPLSHNESAVVCITAWGEETPTGQPAMVSLNGGGVYSGSEGVTFEFLGLHPPTIVDAYFTVAATSLVVKFGAPPPRPPSAFGRTT
jgi:hypothetical protein